MGVVRQVGPGVADFAPGDRVACTGGQRPRKGAPYGGWPGTRNAVFALHVSPSSGDPSPSTGVCRDETGPRRERGRIVILRTRAAHVANAGTGARTNSRARPCNRRGPARLSLFLAAGLVGASIATVVAAPVHADIRSCGIGHPSATTQLRDAPNIGFARLTVYSSGADRFEFRVTYSGGSQGEGTASGYSADGSSRTVSLRTGKGKVTTRTDVVLYKGYSTCRIAYLNDSVRVY